MNQRTVVNALVALVVPFSTWAQRIEAGFLQDAPFQITIPDNWHGGLVMYAHGYIVAGREWNPLASEFTQVFLDRDFAVAESGYSRQGWAVEEGISETEQLRRYFVSQFGQPDTTFVVGHSMGGTITIGTIEQYGHHYDGALPLCGAIGPSSEFIEHQVFDMLVTFDALFGDLLEGETIPLPERPAITREEIQAALDQRPDVATGFAERFRVRSAHVSGVLAFFHEIHRELLDRSGGIPIDNRSTVYNGFGDDAQVNERVGRYASNLEAQRYLARFYTPSGLIADPVLAVHTTYDPIVSPDWLARYDDVLALAEREALFAGRFVAADGHCTISPEVTGEAFDDLRAWVATGQRPE